MLLRSLRNKSCENCCEFQKRKKTQQKNSKTLQPQNNYHSHVTPLSLQLTITLSAFNTQTSLVTILLNSYPFAIPLDTLECCWLHLLHLTTLTGVRGKLLH